MPLLQLTLLVTMSFVVASAGLDMEIKCLESEKQALLKIKGDLIDSYGYLSTWVTSQEYPETDCCQWERVQCNNTTGHVVGLLLNGSDSDHPMSGKINPSLVELKHLKVLDLSHNYFNGSEIPKSIGSLIHLTYLNLSNANFGGNFPVDQFQNLTKLQDLDLSRNSDIEYQNLLRWLPHFSSLRTLNLSRTDLKRIGDGWRHVIKKLEKLERLGLSECRLEDNLSQSIPRTNLSSQDYTLGYGNSSLTYIDLSMNSLSSSIFKWLLTVGDKVTHLDLSYNSLESPIPDNLGEVMPSLASLYLRYCQLIGGIPKSIGNICTLRNLGLNENMITGELSEIVGNLSGCAVKSLETLSLGYNHVMGSTLSLDTIGKFRVLKRLDLGHNKLNGSFPTATQLSRLFQLEDFYVPSNFLVGVITESHLENLSRLKVLDLSYNLNLSLRISPNWIPPFQLDGFKAAWCRLGPAFPKWLQNQKGLTQLDISGGGISDVLPVRFWDLLHNIDFLNVSYNQLSGSLPNLKLRINSSVSLLDFSSNNFEGPIQHFPSSVEILNLAVNRFSGSLSTLCDLEYVYYIDLSQNLFSGEIPDCLARFSWLHFLHLRNNSLSGHIPDSFGSLNQFESIDLSNNNLSGTLPLSMKHCRDLTFLDVGENRLFDEIPTWIGEKLLGLMFLILRQNQFYGSIPSKFCRLDNLLVLDMSMNNISGPIPHCFNHLTAMTTDVAIVDVLGYLSIRDANDAVVPNFNYYDSVTIPWQGRGLEYKKSTIHLLNVINLASNKLEGEIPDTLMELLTLRGLNLSRNFLSGSIPKNIGLLKHLELLDLSYNCLSGKIPSTISDISSLESLNLSYNQLSGRIPLGTQIQITDPSAFIHNLALCGQPLSSNCTRNLTDQPPAVSGDAAFEGEDEFNDWFLGGMGCGFFVGFCGVCLLLTFNDTVRHAFFRAMSDSGDWIYVTLIVHVRRLRMRVAAFWACIPF